MWQSWMGWKMQLCKWHTFWMVQCLICYFMVILFHIERKWLLMRNLATILPLKSELPAKLQHLNAIDGSIKMLKRSWISKKIRLKWKIAKHFTRLKQRAALRKLFSLPPTHPHQIKPYCVFQTKIFWQRYTEAHRHLLLKCFKNTVLGRQEKVQCKCFFWHQTETCLLEHLQSQRGKFLLENLKIKKKSSDDVYWYVWTNIKTLYARNNIFKKRIPNVIFWIIHILVQISLYFGDSSRAF